MCRDILAQVVFNGMYTYKPHVQLFLLYSMLHSVTRIININTEEKRERRVIPLVEKGTVTQNEGK